jgi:hypothetical protein
MWTASSKDQALAQQAALVLNADFTAGISLTLLETLGNACSA